MQRIGIYGGTFNPPHMGHIRAAEQAIHALKLDKLLLMPGRIAPYKKLPANSPTPEQRLEMLRLAATHPKMEVSDLELCRGEDRYTYLTVERIRQQYPEAELFLLLGSDMFLSSQTGWNRIGSCSRRPLLSSAGAIRGSVRQ